MMTDNKTTTTTTPHVSTHPPTTGTNKKRPSESDIYDRQIRLWGAEAQAKMSKAQVLYIHVTGVSSEVVKNLVLAGIRATICDTRSLDDVQETPSILLPPGPQSPLQKKEEEEATTTTTTTSRKKTLVGQAVQPFVEELNPLLGTCPLLEKDASDLTQDDLQNFSVVVASQIGIYLAIRISHWTTQKGGIFYLCDTFGMNGACLIDLGKDYKYRPEQGKQLLEETTLPSPPISLEQLWKVPLAHAINRFHKSPPTVYVQYRCLLEYERRTHHWPTEDVADQFCQTIQTEVLANATTGNKGSTTKDVLQDHPAVTLQALKTLAKQASSEVAPVCAVLGGLIGNEVIKVISGKGEPAYNTLLLEGTTCKAWTFLIQPKKL